MAAIRELIRETRILDLGPLPAPRLAPTATVQQAIQMLVRARRGAVVVVDGSRPVGIFTERDVLAAANAELLTSSRRRRGTPLRKVMSQPPVTVRGQATLLEALGAMAGRHYRHLVVVDREGDLRGLLTTNDLVQFLTDQFPEETVNLPPRLRQQYQTPEGG